MTIYENGGPAFPVEARITNQGMTLRQYAAIKLRVPDSGTDWLDEMIVKSKRDDFAAKAMQAILSSPHLDGNLTLKALAADSYNIADAMLIAREVNKEASHA